MQFMVWIELYFSYVKDYKKERKKKEIQMNVGGEGDDVLEYMVIEILGFIANNSNKKSLNI